VNAFSAWWAGTETFFHDAEDVGELEPQEVDVLLVDLVDYRLFVGREAAVRGRVVVGHVLDSYVLICQYKGLIDWCMNRQRRLCSGRS
jgi:hypothetical protein